MADTKFTMWLDEVNQKRKKQWDKEWQALKQKAYHPLTYDKTFTKKKRLKK